MTRAFWLLAGMALVPMLRGQGTCASQAPCFTAAGVVNAASGSAVALTPNTLISIYGLNFSLPFSNLQVMIGGMRALVFYVSPSTVAPAQQVNALIPCSLTAGVYSMYVVRDSWYSQAVSITLQDVAPAFFQADSSNVIAVRPDGSAVTTDAPAKAGEIILLYATGLGPTQLNAQCVSDAPPASADSIPRSGFDILLNGVAVPREKVLYAGVAPGFSGLYQINLQLPDAIDPDPEIRMSLSGQTSPPNLHLHAQ